MSIELTPVEKSRLYLAQVDALKISDDPQTIRHRMLERRAWLSTHLDPQDYADALLLAEAIDTKLVEMGHGRSFALSLREVRDAAETDLTECVWALELLGAYEVRPGVYGNTDSLPVVEIGNLGNWRTLV
ncbi:hypothetical protein [Ruegeria sp. Ofav3-42]|uniref:hypothetical protein n=1 Tax=Ruegeria sp. Ofav3-42 TaxID=2917759 RepID=UPI001EF6597F|nr:hypothetical protein [Ruegeria sp. Ofav3-42]MCG7518446.1 hypothetical protein [Ruegeria sp. Ofav3-42]